MSIDECLNELKNSENYHTSTKILDNIIKNELELTDIELKELITITVENKWVFGVLEFWKDKKYPKNLERREFFSKKIKTLLDEVEKLDTVTLNNINRIYNTIYLSLLKKDNRKEDVFLYHANSVITSLGFITSKKLFSRKYGEDTGLPQTYQKSDEGDRQKDIFNDIFFDNSDIGEKVICYYGPITFIFKAQEILNSENEIQITKYNPIEDTQEYLYFSSLSEIEEQMLRYIRGEDGGYHFFTKFKHHTTVKNCDYIEITKDNLECIMIENDINVDEVKSTNHYSSEKIKEMIMSALEKVNLKGVKVVIRKEYTRKKNDLRSKDGNPYSTEIDELWSSDFGILYRRK